MWLLPPPTLPRFAGEELTWWFALLVKRSFVWYVSVFRVFSSFVIFVIFLFPFVSLDCWIIRSIAWAICGRMAWRGMFVLPISIMVSILKRLSSGLFAWTVVRDPLWPVFMAWSMSIASWLRISPTTILSGRILSAFFRSVRMVTSPLPSMFGVLDSRDIKCW